VVALLCSLYPVRPAEAQGSEARPRAVIELFTSQGCSSCPPADRLMAEWAQRPDLIILSMPVDYWDYLGWKDTLADPAFSRRQKGYAAARGDRQVYTPQAVINGQSHAVGSDRRALEAMLASDSTPELAVSIIVEPAAEGALVKVGAAPGARSLSAGLWLVPVFSHRTVQVGRGENSGRTITYANVARAPQRLADWSGTPLTLPLRPAAMPEGADHFVVLLQGSSDKKPGVILGAAKGTFASR
jgi:hypothetical protein